MISPENFFIAEVWMDWGFIFQITVVTSSWLCGLRTASLKNGATEGAKPVVCIRNSAYSRTYYWLTVYHLVLPDQSFCIFAVPGPHRTSSDDSCDPKNWTPDPITLLSCKQDFAENLGSGCSSMLIFLEFFVYSCTQCGLKRIRKCTTKANLYSILAISLQYD